jgi:thiamine-monophosphate kinase
MEEFSLIDHFLRPLALAPEALGLRDDAALLASRPGHRLVVSADMLQAGVHFFADDPPDAIAQKALRVNLSDLAAMGAEPYGYFLCLGLPEGMDETWLRAFCDGLSADQATYGITLLGGDTTRTHGPLSLSLTVMGWVPEGQALHRMGARPGDQLCVSGTLGDAALGLIERPSAAHARYLRPLPRLSLGTALRGVATAAMDISDGLVQDAGHLASASGVGLRMEAARVPLSMAVRDAIAEGRFTLAQVLTGGDDYELLFTLPPDIALPPETTCIGEVTTSPGLQVVDASGHPMHFARPGYRHRWEASS